MHSFKPNILQRLASHEISHAIGAIRETKGRQELYEQRKPEVLNNLRQVAVVESTESSNRLEGVTAPREVLDKIIQSGRPLDADNRSEAEIAGYRAVLGQIHESHADIPFTVNVVRQFHRDLMQFSPAGGGEWKFAPNEITRRDPDGEKTILARTTSPWQVEQQMTALHGRYEEQLAAGVVDPLALIALYVMDFLCIHPFADGNGRMSRLLTVLMLYHRGHQMARYISLERIIEETKASYYETLNRSDRGWHEGGRHNPVSWVEYFLSVLVKACNEFTRKVNTVSTAYGMKKALVIQAVEQTAGPFAIAEIGRKCPSVGRDTLRGTLMSLKKQGYLKVLGRGRHAQWQKTGKPFRSQ